MTLRTCFSVDCFTNPGPPDLCADRPGEDTLKRLDGSVKKNSAFVKKLVGSRALYRHCRFVTGTNISEHAQSREIRL